MNNGNSNDRNTWEPGTPTKFGMADEGFLRKILRSGHVAYTGPIGLFGGKSKQQVGGESHSRSVDVIHRGLSRRWEICLDEDDTSVASEFVDNLEAAAIIAVHWLNGVPKEDAIASLAKLAIQMPRNPRKEDG